MNLIEIFRKLNPTKRNALLAIIFFLIGPIIGFHTERFRYTPDLRWVYHIGWVLAYIFGFGAITLSFTNSIILLKEFKSEWGKKLIWLVISSIPLLYYTIMIVIGMTQNID